MHILSDRPQIASVPTGLLIAAIDFITMCRPEQQLVEAAIMALARRLDYDQITAAALAKRVCATARMFADPQWSCVRQLGWIGDASYRAEFEAVVQQFIATAPLGVTLAFDVSALQRMLLAALPPHGNS